jgi:hypothetical protein
LVGDAPSSGHAQGNQAFRHQKPPHRVNADLAGLFPQTNGADHPIRPVAFEKAPTARRNTSLKFATEPSPIRYLNVFWHISKTMRQTLVNEL